MAERLVIPRRFRGPPESGNGGYSAGLLARLVDSPAVEVTLRLPPPLDRELAVERDGARVLLRDHELLVAEAEPTALHVEPPPLPAMAEVEAATRRFTGLDAHPFPSCFVCGTEREPGDGLRIFPGPVEGAEGVIAAPWTPPLGLADASGELPLPIVWAALDCPAGWSHLSERITALLGRMAAQQLAPVRAGERYVVLACATGSEGRRLFSESALLTADGGLVGVARTTWVRVDAFE